MDQASMKGKVCRWTRHYPTKKGNQLRKDQLRRTTKKQRASSLFIIPSDGRNYYTLRGCIGIVGFLEIDRVYCDRPGDENHLDAKKPRTTSGFAVLE